MPDAGRISIVMGCKAQGKENRRISNIELMVSVYYKKE